MRSVGNTGPLAALALMLLSVATAPAADGWLMNNVAQAQEQARKTGKPIFVVFRCER
jgi:hypothetical protein